MKTGIFPWLKAARLRTLPLTLVCIGTGGSLACYRDCFSWPVWWLSLITAVLLQILSNFANDYGDFVKGTDNENRVGPERALQSGALSVKQMRIALVALSLIALFSGVYLIYEAPGLSSASQWLAFLGLGLLSILAAVTYTVGKNAYGYKGLGDVMVFLFFGLTGVVGAFYLHAGSWPFAVWLPATSVGLFSVGVLNMNNTRDMENDRESGKITVPVRIGLRGAKAYQAVLILGGVICTGWYFLSIQASVGLIWLFPSFAVFAVHLVRVMKERTFRAFDTQLKVCVGATLLWGFGFMGFHFLHGYF
jgi:1,4-dihydroxy-2-naphthoate octaprenyltransferase